MDNNPNGPFLLDTPAQKEARERAEEQRRDRRQRDLQLGFNGALMIAAILTAGIVLYQNAILDDSLTEMQRTNENMRAAIGQTAQALDLTKESLLATQKANEIAGSAARSTETQTQITREQLRQGTIAQRAWIGVSWAKNIEFNFDDAGAMRARVYFVNTGETPAFNVRVRGSVIRQRADRPLDQELVRQTNLVKPDGTATMMPGAELSILVAGQWEKGFAVKELSAAGTLRVYLLGTITYADFMGVERETRYCAYLSPLLTFQTCTEHNTAR